MSRQDDYIRIIKLLFLEAHYWSQFRVEYPLDYTKEMFLKDFFAENLTISVTQKELLLEALGYIE